MLPPETTQLEQIMLTWKGFKNASNMYAPLGSVYVLHKQLQILARGTVGTSLYVWLCQSVS